MALAIPGPSQLLYPAHRALMVSVRQPDVRFLFVTIRCHLSSMLLSYKSSFVISASKAVACDGISIKPTVLVCECSKPTNPSKVLLHGRRWAAVELYQHQCHRVTHFSPKRHPPSCCQHIQIELTGFYSYAVNSGLPFAFIPYKSSISEHE